MSIEEFKAKRVYCNTSKLLWVNRIEVLHYIDQHGPVFVNKIAKELKIDQSVASATCKDLLAVGIVKKERRGRFNYYVVEEDRLAGLQAAIALLAEGTMTVAEDKEYMKKIGARIKNRILIEGKPSQNGYHE